MSRRQDSRGGRGDRPYLAGILNIIARALAPANPEISFRIPGRRPSVRSWGGPCTSRRALIEPERHRARRPARGAASFLTELRRQTTAILGAPARRGPDAGQPGQRARGRAPLRAGRARRGPVAAAHRRRVPSHAGRRAPAGQHRDAGRRREQPVRRRLRAARARGTRTPNPTRPTPGQARSWPREAPGRCFRGAGRPCPISAARAPWWRAPRAATPRRSRGPAAPSPAGPAGSGRTRSRGDGRQAGPGGARRSPIVLGGIVVRSRVIDIYGLVPSGCTVGRW